MVPSGSFMYSLEFILGRSIAVSAPCAALALSRLGPGGAILSLVDAPDVELDISVERRLELFGLLLGEELGWLAKTRIEDVWDATDARRVVGGTVLHSIDDVEIEAEFLVWLAGSLDSKISLA
jgi:hypothetical protein